MPLASSSPLRCLVEVGIECELECPLLKQILLCKSAILNCCKNATRLTLADLPELVCIKSSESLKVIVHEIVLKSERESIELVVDIPKLKKENIEFTLTPYNKNTWRYVIESSV